MSSKSDSLHHNGRSTSQISIYDYPEHLNPFYEAENHKRIRFWKIGKNKTNNNNNNGLNRRGSFSLNGLKEMWAFKSFRPKKQSSTSTTFINKTSESPPPLRRDLQNDNYGTYDPRMRNTMQNDSFQRNVPYRASLQDVSRSSTTTTNEYQNGFGNSFGRNQQYRSTIQTPHRMKRYDNSISNSSTPQNLTPLHRRYVYGGSVTPQPTIRNNNFKGYNYKFDDSNSTTTTNFSRGSSQLSVATNPFDDDDDDIVMGHSINSASSTTSLNSRPVRKKRRAPQPPSPNSPVSKAIEEESTSQKFQNNENNDILNLTAEIETFVKNSDNDISKKNNNTKELIITEEPNISNSDSQKIKNNENLTTTTTIIIQNRIHNSDENYPKATPRSSKKTEKIKTNLQQISPKIIITETENNKDNEKLDYNKNLPSKTEVITEKTEKIINQSNKNNVELENDNVDSMKVTEKFSSDSNQYSQTNGYINSEIEIDHQQTNTENYKNENSNYHNNNNNKLENNNNDTKQINIINPTTNDEITDKLTISTNELKITESEDDISNLPIIENENELGKYQIRYVPLKDNSPTIQRRNSRSTSPPPDNYDLPPVPMARRRSVREIIESINRSQSLLKPHSKDIVNCNNNNYNYEIKENNLNKTTTEKQFYENNDEIKINNKEVIKQSSPTLSVEQNDNNIIFEKCTTFINNNNNNNSRESSPTTSNLDWNPVPKPKRTSKLSAELMITEN